MACFGALTDRARGVKADTDLAHGQNLREITHRRRVWRFDITSCIHYVNNPFSVNQN